MQLPASDIQGVIIAGGGAAGWMAAGLLAQAGHAVTVVDPAPGPQPEPVGGLDSRVIALAPSSRALFEQLNAWPPAVAARAGAYQSMQVWDAQGQGRIAFSAAEIGLPELGHIVEYSALQWALEQALVGQVQAVRGDRVVDFRPGPGQVDVDLASGATLGARLLVGADGADSVVRRRAGLTLERRSYNSQGVVASFRTRHPHAGVARQAFTEHGPLGLLPLADGQISIVWSVDDSQARRLADLESQAFSSAVSQAAGDAYGGLQLVGERRVFPLNLMHAGRYAASRVALLGDAAHVVHPLAGLGLNLGFADAHGLLGAIGGAQDPGGQAVLARYARRRRAEVLPAIALTDSLVRLFGPHAAQLVGLRSLGLSLVNQAAPLKRQLMHYAVGGGRAHSPAWAKTV